MLFSSCACMNRLFSSCLFLIPPPASSSSPSSSSPPHSFSSAPSQTSDPSQPPSAPTWSWSAPFAPHAAPAVSSGSPFRARILRTPSARSTCAPPTSASSSRTVASTSYHTRIQNYLLPQILDQPLSPFQTLGSSLARPRPSDHPHRPPPPPAR